MESRAMKRTPHGITIAQLAGILATTFSTLAVAAPPPGHPSAEQAIEQLGIPLAGAEQPLPYRAVVLTAIDSNAFTYIELRDLTSHATRWVAAPKTALKAGSRIRHDEGRVMTNFHSRKLDVTFPSIMFVNRVVIDESL